MDKKELDDQIKQLRRARLRFVAILLSVGIIITGAIFFLQHTGIIGLTMSGIGIIIVCSISRIIPQYLVPAKKV